MGQVYEIKIEQIKKVAKNLRRLDKNWAEQLAARMGMPVEKVYNISLGRVSGQISRVAFLLHAKELGVELQTKVKAALKSIK